MIRIFKRLAGVILWCFSSAWQEKKHCRIREPILRLKKRTSDTPGNKYNESSGWKIPEKYESYLRDQFPGRDHWVSFQTDMELFMGKNEIHNVYIGKNHYLLEHYTEKEFDPQQISKNLQALEKFVGKTKQNADVHVMMVPTKSWVLREKLPAFAPHYKEQKFYDALQQKLEKRMY